MNCLVVFRTAMPGWGSSVAPQALFEDLLLQQGEKKWHFLPDNSLYSYHQGVGTRIPILKIFGNLLSELIYKPGCMGIHVHAQFGFLEKTFSAKGKKKPSAQPVPLPQPVLGGRELQIHFNKIN